MECGALNYTKRLHILWNSTYIIRGSPMEEKFVAIQLYSLIILQCDCVCISRVHEIGYTLENIVAKTQNL